MALVNEEKKELIQKYKTHEKDTGSPEVQVALLTTRINGLTEHLKKHDKDRSSRHGLLQLVNKRRRLLDYLKTVDYDRYKNLIEKLKLRK
ncbi:MAG: 30S ribosomal protein S15 [Spirochaetia bacterium]|nr:30S ribosomal protein S15 [Spirochaetia bacterium]